MSLGGVFYVKSYDRFDEFLRYELPRGDFAVIGRCEFEALVAAPALGAFTREDGHVAGVFASPEGPVVFLDSHHVVARFGVTTARVEPAGSPGILRFTLIHDASSGGANTFEVLYSERHGLGANPYDTEPEDVDLFALIASGLRDEKFFRAYTWNG